MNAVSAATPLKSAQISNGRSHFDFTAMNLAEDSLSDGQSHRIEYIGSATSNFQSEPLLYDKEGRPHTYSDWEYELTRRIHDQRCGIPDAEIADLPQFLCRKEMYVNRSADLGENMLRLSLEFGRLCPQEGQFNEPLMVDYVKALALIRLRGQEPFMTLNHFTMPKSLIKTDREGNIQAGGWEHRDVVRYFRFYVESVTRFLADESRIRGILAGLNLNHDLQEKMLSQGLVRYFMTINEPTVLLLNGYLSGIFPPYMRGSLLMVRRLLKTLVEAHDIARDQIKHGLRAQEFEPQIGVGHNWQFFEGRVGKLSDWFQEYFVTHVERDGKHSDFLGIQYYFRWEGLLSAEERRRRDYSDHPSFGDVNPQGIFNIIRNFHSHYGEKPIFISEFGFSDSSDLRRPYWILETVRHILLAKSMGVPIKGILLWTLVNNFEWQLGMSQKFGLHSESELNAPLIPSTKGIRSWEAWRAITQAIRCPTTENWQQLQRCHQAAYVQYKEAGGKN